MTTDHYFTLVTSREAMTEIRDSLRGEGVEFSDPIMSESPADLLDSPIGAGEVADVLQLVTVYASTGTALLTFTGKLLSTIKGRKNERAQIINAEGGVEVEITESTSEETVRKAFER